MTNTDMIATNESYLIDVSTDKPVSAGSKIYLRTKSITFPFINILAVRPRILINPDFNTDDVGSYLGSNWSRRKSDISYQGFNQPVITVNGWIDLDSPGSLSDDIQLATVNRLWKMFSSPTHMPYYFWDSKIGSALANGDYDDNMGNPYDQTGGSIPVLIKDFNVDWRESSLNKLEYTLVLWEDK